MKKCTQCGEDKPLSAYYFETRRGKKKPRPTCKDCHKANVYERREQNPERHKEIEARYRERNREKINERQRLGRELHGDKYNQQRRQRRAENPEAVRAVERAWLEANRERNRETQRSWYAANREHSLRWKREHRKANPDLYRKWARESRKRYPDKVKARYDAWREANKEHIAEYRREYYKRRPEVTLDAQHRRRAKKMAADSEKFDRMEIYERDKGICQHCGDHRPRDKWELDHIIPFILGGAHTRRNTRVLCKTCNTRKGGKLDVLCEHLPVRLLLPERTISQQADLRSA